MKPRPVPPTVDSGTIYQSLVTLDRSMSSCQPRLLILVAQLDYSGGFQNLSLPRRQADNGIGISKDRGLGKGDVKAARCLTAARSCPCSLISLPSKHAGRGRTVPAPPHNLCHPWGCPRFECVVTSLGLRPSPPPCDSLLLLTVSLPVARAFPNMLFASVLVDRTGNPRSGFRGSSVRVHL